MCYNPIEPVKSIDYLDVAFKSATIFIALFNAYFAIKIFSIKSKKDEVEKESDRKIQLLKTLILDHNLKNFYALFDELENQLLALKQSGLSDNDKGVLDLAIGETFISLRRRFYDSLLAVDEKLYEKVKDKADKFQSELTNTIFDAGINLSHSPKYNEAVTEKLTLAKTEIIRILFSYRG